MSIRRNLAASTSLHVGLVLLLALFGLKAALPRDSGDDGRDGIEAALSESPAQPVAAAKSAPIPVPPPTNKEHNRAPSSVATAANVMSDAKPAIRTVPPVPKDLPKVVDTPPPAETEPRTAKAEPPVRTLDDVLTDVGRLGSYTPLDRPAGEAVPIIDAAQPETAPIDAPSGVAVAAAGDGLDRLGAHLSRCWTVDPGQTRAGLLTVDLNVVVDDRGRLAETTQVDPSRYYREADYRAAADRAARALNDCAPLPVSAPAGATRALRLRFDPSHGFGMGGRS